MALDRDVWLAQLLELMQAAQFAASITLTTAGLLVSGEPISASEFIRLSGAGVVEAMEPLSHEAAETLDRYFEAETRSAEAWLQQSQERREALTSEQRGPEGARSGQTFGDTWSELYPQFIHLKNAVIVGPFPQPVHLPLWRGRLAAIIGWCFGGLGATEVHAPEPSGKGR